LELVPVVCGLQLNQRTYALLPFKTLPSPAIFTGTQVTPDFQSPFYDSFSFELQREVTRDLVFRVATSFQGSGLFESIDGNPVVFRSDHPTAADPL